MAKAGAGVGSAACSDGTEQKGTTGYAGQYFNVVDCVQCVKSSLEARKCSRQAIEWRCYERRVKDSKDSKVACCLRWKHARGGAFAIPRPMYGYHVTARRVYKTVVIGIRHSFVVHNN